MHNPKAGNPLTVILMALAALALLSMLPWDSLSGGRLHSFNLLGDLLPESDRSHITDEDIDPALAAIALQPTPAIPADSADSADSTATVRTPVDSTATEPVPQPPLPADFTAPRTADGTVLIEDFSTGGEALRRLHAALSEAARRPVRIAVVGDSYIEGDIFTQNLRSLLQDRYGGSGVGYMAAHSDFPGFRQSVRQTSSGWEERDMRHIGSDHVKPLCGVYYAATAGASVTYKGSRRPAHADSWSRSTLLFIATASGSVTFTTAGGTTVRHIDASPDVQAVSIDGTTSQLGISTDIAGLKMLGAWLETPTGIVLDCMSLRGNSGLTHRNINAALSEQMRRTIDYDLIVMEYGINALSAAQRDYSAYAAVMTEAVNTVKAQYPGAVIMVMGIGDRGQKRGTEVRSMDTAPAMVRAQRDIARRTGSLFWDTRAAMGSDGAAVDWHDRKLVNADYVHLNHKGGAELARIFANSLHASLND